MRKKLAALLFVLTAAFSSTALALAPKKAAKPAKAAKRTADGDPILTGKDDCRLQWARNPNKVCEFSYTGDEVEGGVEGPGGHYLDGRPQSDHPSLMRYREDFVDRITASTEQR